MKGEELAVAVCAQCTVKANKTSNLEFCLTWDMPVIHFGSKQTKYCRYVIALIFWGPMLSGYHADTPITIKAEAKP